MADSPTIQGNYPDGSVFKFSLDGVSTHAQMERLIKLTAVLAKKESADNPEEKRRLEALEKGTREYKEQTKHIRESNKEFDTFQESLESASAVTGLFKGHLLSSIRAFDTPLAKLAAGMGGMVAGFMNYADDLRPALQRGITGGVLDFAVSAKSAGLSLTDFNKALTASGGTFTMLGDGATSGSRAFSGLINNVRAATASVGNLGMNNEQLAEFTATQLKISVQQGLRGKQAQDAVVRTTRELGKEFDNLADRTGKTIQEMAEAAAKLISDPTVSSFLATLGKGADKASAAMQAVGANMTAMFGKTGEKFANEAAQAAASGLPLAFSKMGQQMAGFAPALYGETERQMKRAAAGFMPTEEDRKRMLDAALAAERTQGESLRAMAALGGEAGETAKQVLAMAQEARSYNTEANKEKRARNNAAQEFNAEVNKLSANFNQLTVPFLQLLNGIDWTMMFQVLNGFASTVKFLLKPLEWIGNILGASGAGTVIGGFLGLVTVGALLVSGFGMLGKAVKGLVDVIMGGITKLGLLSTAVGAGRAGPAAAGVRDSSAIINRAREANKPVVDRANELYQGYGGRIDRAEALKQAKKEHLASMGTGLEGQRKREDYIRLQAEAQRSRDESRKSPVPEVETKLTKAGTVVEKFAGAIAGVTTALAGSGMVIAGEALLREDANSKLGQFLVTWGNVITVGGTLAGIVLQLAPAVAASVSAMTAYVATNGGAILALKAFTAKLWLSTKGLGSGLMMILTKFGTGLATAGRFLLPLLPALGALAIPLLKVAAIVGAVGLALYGLYKAVGFLWDGVKWVADKLWNGLTAVWDGVKQVGTWLVDGIKFMGNTLWSGLSSVWDGLKSIGSSIANSASSLWNTMTKPFTALWDWLKSSWLGKKLFGDSSSTQQSSAKMDPYAPQNSIISSPKNTVISGTDPAYWQNKGGVVNDELINTQTSAIDQRSLRESENTKQLVALNKNMESLIESSDANVSLQGKNISVNEGNGRYLRQRSMFGSSVS